MVHLHDICKFLNHFLQSQEISDYCPNGLQVDGKSEIHKIVTGVTASQALIDEAIDVDADAILVHHGYFWKHEDPCVTGIKFKRLQALIQNNISLLAYHLPLDLHPEIGNNAQLAVQLDIEIDDQLLTADGLPLIFRGQLADEMTGAELAKHITDCLDREPLHIAGSDQLIKTVAWCTGAAQDFIDTAINAGVDAYITGEVSERTVHQARENNIHFYAAGHHATERYGVATLGEHLARKFSIEHEFIDIDNPV